MLRGHRFVHFLASAPMEAGAYPWHVRDKVSVVKGLRASSAASDGREINRGGDHLRPPKGYYFRPPLLCFCLFFSSLVFLSQLDSSCDFKCSSYSVVGRVCMFQLFPLRCEGDITPQHMFVRKSSKHDHASGVLMFVEKLQIFLQTWHVC